MGTYCILLYSIKIILRIYYVPLLDEKTNQKWNAYGNIYIYNFGPLVVGRHKNS